MVNTFLGVVVANLLHGFPDNLLVVHDGGAGDLTEDDDHACLGGTLWGCQGGQHRASNNR